MAAESRCPSRSLVRKFAAGACDSTEATHVGNHLLACPHCSRLAENSREVKPWVEDPPVSGRTASPRTQTFSDVTQPHAASPPIAVFPFLALPRESGEIGRLGIYRILGILGEGGMGIVFHAEDTVLQRAVALKVMQPDLANVELAHARFLREARSAAAIAHANVIPILQVGEEHGTPFLVMPLLQGRTLAAQLADEPRPGIPDIFRVGRAVAEGLAAAHDRGLVHRDIKPANIWIEDCGDTTRTTRHIRILDFGLARLANRHGGNDGLTAAGIAMGTPHYMSPEQTRAAPLDHRTDLFSLGTVLYEMGTGGLPFNGVDPIAVLAAVVAHRPASPRTINPQVPAELDQLIMRLLAKNPNDRPGSATAVSAELKRIWLAVVRSRTEPARPATPVVLRAVERVAPMEVPVSRRPVPPVLVSAASAPRGRSAPHPGIPRIRRTRPTTPPANRSAIAGMGLLVVVVMLVWGALFLFAGRNSPTHADRLTGGTPSTHVNAAVPPTGPTTPTVLSGIPANSGNVERHPPPFGFPPPPPPGFPPPPFGFPPPPPPPR